MKFTKPKVDGDVFAQPDSLLNPQGMDKSKDFASAAVKTALTTINMMILDGFKLASAINCSRP